MRKCVLYLVFLFIPFFVISGDSHHKYWVYLQDKPISFSIDNPLEFLSEEALLRRTRFNIKIHYSDLPVSLDYQHQLSQFGTIANVSRWFNSISIFLPDSVVDHIETLTFVRKVEKVKSYKLHKDLPDETSLKVQAVPLNGNFYGEGFHQIEMLKGNYLHQKNFLGKGVIIGLMDSGYKKANENLAFTNVFAEGRILGTHDFVEEDLDIYTVHSHGANVLSIIASFLPGQMVGTAPEASFYLFRTEDSGSESLVEEDNWVAAAEMADQLGVHVLNTSLGYSTFDDTTTNHEYADLDGNTTLITRAADMAAKKGMLPVTSAGNEGDKPWFHITVPADGDSVLAVGAIDEFGQVASFSGRGPASDGDIKPNVCALGVSTTIVSTAGEITESNGTSFSAPIISGLAACLWQAFPDKTNIEILRAIEHSSDLTMPNNECGYGLPDFELAFNILANDLIDILDSDNSNLLIAPNPVQTNVKIFYKAAEEGVHSIGVYDLAGNEVYFQELFLYDEQYNKINFNLEFLSQGLYIVRIIQNDIKIEGLIVKTQK